MEKIPYQFRYYKQQNKRILNNIPEEKLFDGTLFIEYPRISQIGIQSHPGVQFKLNGGKNWIEVGETGIYELDLTGIGNIREIIFNQERIQKEDFFVLVDIIYVSESNNKEAIPLDTPFTPGDFEVIIHGGDANDILN